MRRIYDHVTNQCNKDIRIEVLDEPERVPSAFVRGYKSMMVRIPA